MFFKNQRAISLTELLVATIAVSIIMLAVVSIDRALQQSHQGTSRNALINMKTSAMMLHISKNVQLATGYKTPLGFDGIQDNIDIPDTLCIRKEDPGNLTPGDYTDDIWACYTLSTNDVNFCETDPGGSAAACTAVSSSFKKVIGTVINNPSDSPGVKGFTAEIFDDSSTGEFYVEVTLINRQIPTAVRDSFKNPEITLTSKITPPAMGSSIE